MLDKKLILLTGATGNMGSATLSELLARSDRFRVRALVLPRERQHKVVRLYRGHPALDICFGDLTNSADVRAAVDGADQVLHIGGLVSPLADRQPELTMRVNVEAARNIVDAIKLQPNPNSVSLVYIGTVAQTGHRNAPVHWGSAGDPIKISRFDAYASSKTKAEAIIAESGLEKWVSLRQTGIAHPNLWRVVDPIAFHTPLNGVLEWVTVGDSARLAANCCEDSVPPVFWRRFHNVGGGAAMRLVNHEFLRLVSTALGIDDVRSTYEPHWFATRNFHGQWYADSDRLHELVPFRRETMADFIAAFRREVPSLVQIAARRLPAAVKMRMATLARSERGTLRAIERHDEAFVEAYFGSREAWEALPRTWDTTGFKQPSREVRTLDHGWKVVHDEHEWDASELRQAAAFRGATLIDGAAGAYDRVRWRCALEHEFTMSANLYLRGGHWCPTCMLDQAHYASNAIRNPFFAQVWPDRD